LASTLSSGTRYAIYVALGIEQERLLPLLAKLGKAFTSYAERRKTLRKIRKLISLRSIGIFSLEITHSTL
jgi:hypothetical protein